MPGPGNILIKIGADAGQAIRELSTVERALGDTMSTTDRMGAGLKKAAVPAALALGAIAVAAVDATQAAAEDAAAQEHLAGVLERVAGASSAQVAATEKWISGISRATGVADDELRPALENIATATHDVGKAQELMSQALDISAASGKDLNTVSVAIAKAYTGQTGALEKLVPGLSKAAKESDDFNVIMGELARTTGGAAAQAASTAEGRYRNLTVQMGELKESLGAALLPIMGQLVAMLQRVVDWANQNTTTIKILIGVVATLSAGILAANAAIKVYEALQIATKVATAAWTAAQWLLNAALSANPIGLVIAAVAALAAGIVIAYTRSETFRSIVTGAFNAVKAAVSAVDAAFDALLASARRAFDWVQDHWKVALFALGPIGAALAVLSSHFNQVKAAGEGAFNAIRGAIEGVAGAISSVIGAVQDLIGWLGRIHVPHINLPGPFMAPPPAAGVAGRSSSSSRATAGGTTINVYGAVDPEGTARAILRLLRQHERRQGLAA